MNFAANKTLFLLLLSLFTPVLGVCANTDPTFIWNSEPANGTCIGTMQTKIDSACSSFQTTFLKKSDTTKAAYSNALTACKNFYQALFTSLHTSCLYHGEAQQRLAPNLDNNVGTAKPGQAGFTAGAAKINTSAYDFNQKWKGEFYKHSVILRRQATVYLNSLRALYNEGRALLEKEYSQCGTKDVSPSVVYLGFSIARTAEAAQDHANANNFLVKSWEDTGRAMDNDRTIETTANRNAIALGIIDRNKNPSESGNFKPATATDRAVHGSKEIAITTAAEKAGARIPRVNHVLGGTASTLAVDAVLKLKAGHWRPIDTAFFALRTILLGSGAIIAVGSGGPLAPGVAWAVTSADVGLVALQQLIDGMRDSKLKNLGEKIKQKYFIEPQADSARLAFLIGELPGANRKCPPPAAQ